MPRLAQNPSTGAAVSFAFAGMMKRLLGVREKTAIASLRPLLPARAKLSAEEFFQFRMRDFQGSGSSAADVDRFVRPGVR